MVTTFIQQNDTSNNCVCVTGAGRQLAVSEWVRARILDRTIPSCLKSGPPGPPGYLQESACENPTDRCSLAHPPKSGWIGLFDIIQRSIVTSACNGYNT